MVSSNYQYQQQLFCITNKQRTLEVHQVILIFHHYILRGSGAVSRKETTANYSHTSDTIH